MQHPDQSTQVPARRFAWLQVASVVLSLSIYVGTYFAYFSAQQSHSNGSYMPMAVGSTLFFALVCTLTYLVLPPQRSAIRLAKAAAFSGAATLVFLYLLLFLLTNTLGS